MQTPVITNQPSQTAPQGPRPAGAAPGSAQPAPRFDNAVRIQGNVAAAARLPWREGMRATDLLANENALIATSYWQAQNLGQGYSAYNRREVNFDYATLRRLEKTTLVTKRLPFNLGKAMRDDARE